MQHATSREARARMVVEHHKTTAWLPILVAMLALWLAMSPFVTSYRSPAHGLLDLLIGLAGAILAAVWLIAPLRFFAQWLIAIGGSWLLLQPLVFWAGAAEYTTDTMIGALWIACSILIPEMPGMMMVMKPGPQVPPGWSYNPSSWLQRAPIIALALIGFFLSRHLAAFQLGHIEKVWEPFFGEGTRRVLTSDVSRAWPISDAGLGAMSYLLEALMGFMGGQDRWRTMPWMVTFFGILVIPLGTVSIVLVIMQPVVVGAWCTLCLLTAALMLFMIPLTLDEVWAMGEFLLRSKRNGKPFWRTFFLGDTIEGGKEQDENAPKFGAPLLAFLPAMVWGLTLPWNLVASALAGVWLMFAPSILGATGRAADNDHLIGALVVTWSVIVLAEVARPARYLNVLFGIWLLIAPWVLPGHSAGARWNTLAVGMLIALFAIPSGNIRAKLGLSDRYLRAA